MTYNPKLQRWEGNEAVLRDFDKALATSTRPALISPLSSTLSSPSRSLFATAFPKNQSTASTGHPPPAGTGSAASRATAKVVGDMVFDPATCSWHSLAGPDAEEALELDWGGGTSGGENADDEAYGGLDGWELGERERMLQTRASFVLEEGSEGDEEGGPAVLGANDADGRRKSTKRQLWREGKAAEERCRHEMRAWTVVGEEHTISRQREWLRELRMVSSVAVSPSPRACI